MSKNRILIFDTTLRDGEQCPGASMNLREKLAVARQLGRLKLDVIEAGFPVISEGDFSAVQAIAKQVKGPQIAGLARCGSLIVYLLLIFHLLNARLGNDFPVQPISRYPKVFDKMFVRIFDRSVCFLFQFL